MPCWARASVSLIFLLFEAVSSSSSLMRSRIGSVCRATYFLRANGFTRPQKPSRASGCKGCLPVAVSPFICVCEEDWVVVDWVWEVELSCAKAGMARVAASSRTTKSVQFFILDFLQVASGESTLRAFQRDCDCVVLMLRKAS